MKIRGLTIVFLAVLGLTACNKQEAAAPVEEAPAAEAPAMDAAPAEGTEAAPAEGAVEGDAATGATEGAPVQ
ncbi:MAG TPA: hypothetical protein VGL10_10410 [Gammaproteobacteria bacterium]